MKTKQEEAQMHQYFKFVLDYAHLQQENGPNDRSVAYDGENIHDLLESLGLEPHLHLVNDINPKLKQGLHENRIKREYYHHKSHDHYRYRVHKEPR